MLWGGRLLTPWRAEEVVTDPVGRQPRAGAVWYALSPGFQWAIKRRQGFTSPAISMTHRQRERRRTPSSSNLLRRLGRSQKSRAAYDKAIELAGNTAQTANLTRRRDQLG